MTKLLIGIGTLLIVVGLLTHFWPRALSWFGRLPGDIRIEGEHGGFYFPVVSMALASIVVSLLWRWLQR